MSLAYARNIGTLFTDSLNAMKLIPKDMFKMCGAVVLLTCLSRQCSQYLLIPKYLRNPEGSSDWG